MLNSVDVRLQLYPILRLLSRKGGYIEFSRFGEIYRLYIEPTGRKAPKQKRRKRAPVELKKIVTTKCAECGGVTIEGICLGANHPVA